MAEQNIKYGAYVALTITNLNSLANSATAGWQSDRISNLSTLALDYEILIRLNMANTAPANDRAVYVFISPAVYDGSTWYQADGGTTTLPSGTQGTYTIAGTTTTNNLDLLRALAYTTADQVIQATMRLSDLYDTMPDGFSIIIVDFSGAAVGASDNIVAYRPITYTVA
jgi:hypothetical protein